VAKPNPTAASMAAECKVKFKQGLGSHPMRAGLMTKLVEQYKTQGFQKRIDAIEKANKDQPNSAISVADHWAADKKNVLRVAKHLARIAVILSGNSPVDAARLIAAGEAIRKSKVCLSVNPAGGGTWCDFSLSF
jgi:hypothetical protein